MSRVVKEVFDKNIKTENKKVPGFNFSDWFKKLRGESYVSPLEYMSKEEKIRYIKGKAKKKHKRKIANESRRRNRRNRCK